MCLFRCRDVACRNCLVSGSYVVKLGDFGMTRPICENNYYKFNREGTDVSKCVPVRVCVHVRACVLCRLISPLIDKKKRHRPISVATFENCAQLN